MAKRENVGWSGGGVGGGGVYTGSCWVVTDCKADDREESNRVSIGKSAMDSSTRFTLFLWLWILVYGTYFQYPLQKRLRMKSNPTMAMVSIENLLRNRKTDISIRLTIFFSCRKKIFLFIISPRKDIFIREAFVSIFRNNGHARLRRLTFHN